jgi:hypothetical protein
MSDEDLLLRVDKGPKKPFNWDRALSITALVVSFVAAGGTVWQARIAEQARKDVLELAEEKPVLHIVGSSAEAIPFLYSPSLEKTWAGITLTIRNAGRAPAKPIVFITDRKIVVSEHQRLENLHNLMETPESKVITEPLLDGKEISTSPTEDERKQYSLGDTVILSGRIRYSDEKTSSWWDLPWCYAMTIPDPRLLPPESPSFPIVNRNNLQPALTDCVGERFHTADSGKP